MVAAAPRDREPRSEDVLDVLCAVSARLESFARGRSLRGVRAPYARSRPDSPVVAALRAAAPEEKEESVRGGRAATAANNSVADTPALLRRTQSDGLSALSLGRLDGRAASANAARARTSLAEAAAERRTISQSRSAMLGRLRELGAADRHARSASSVLRSHSAEDRKPSMTRQKSDPLPRNPVHHSRASSANAASWASTERGSGRFAIVDGARAADDELAVAPPPPRDHELCDPRAGFARSASSVLRSHSAEDRKPSMTRQKSDPLPRNPVHHSRASSANAASWASTERGSGRFAIVDGARAATRRDAKATPLRVTGAESASDKFLRRATRSRGCPPDDAPESSERSASQALSSASAAAALVSAVLSLFGVLLSAASSILAPLCSSRPPWWPRSCESPQRPARQGLEGEGRAPVSPLFPRCFSSEALDCLLSDDVGCVY